MDYLRISGYGLIILTHIYILIFGLVASQVIMHAVINLIAVGLLLYKQYYTKSEK